MDSDVSADAVLSSRASSSLGVANLLHALLLDGGVESVRVAGLGRQAEFGALGDAAGVEGRALHHWVAFLLADEWHLCDPAWSSGLQAKGRFVRDFAEAYFAAAPEEFIVSHFPLRVFTEPVRSLCPLRSLAFPFAGPSDSDQDDSAGVAASSTSALRVASATSTPRASAVERHGFESVPFRRPEAQSPSHGYGHVRTRAEAQRPELRTGGGECASAPRPREAEEESAAARRRSRQALLAPLVSRPQLSQFLVRPLSQRRFQSGIHAFRSYFSMGITACNSLEHTIACDMPFYTIGDHELTLLLYMSTSSLRFRLVALLVTLVFFGWRLHCVILERAYAYGV